MADNEAQKIPTYPFDMAPIEQEFDGLTKFINGFGPSLEHTRASLRDNIKKGDAIESRHFGTAIENLKWLKAQKATSREVTNDVINEQQLRVNAIGAVHAATRYPGLGAVDILRAITEMRGEVRELRSEVGELSTKVGELSTKVGELSTKVDRSTESSELERITNRNHKRRSANVVAMQTSDDGQTLKLLKEILGSGYEKAEAVDTRSQTRATDNITVYRDAALGSPFPDDIPQNLDDITDILILQLISYYNTDFGIVRTDNLASRVEKYKKWLMIDMNI